MKNLIQRNAAIAALSLLSVLASCKRESVSPNSYGVENSSTNSLRQANNLTVGCGSENLQQHFITMDYAFELVNNYQAASKKGEISSKFDKGGWILAESFPAEVIQKVINQPGCCKFRIYNGLDKDNRQHMIIVGVNEFGADILSYNGRKRLGQSLMRSDSAVNLDNLEVVVEMGSPCPMSCPGVYVGE
jgi:hypothetical protein